MTVALQSRDPGDGGQPYALACSFARRPGTRFANGEWLDLDTGGPLFVTTVFNALPGIFRNFQGTTDRRGSASARIDIPASIPVGLGIPLFVAGVIYDSGGVRTVTNTHGFVLR